MILPVLSLFSPYLNNPEPPPSPAQAMTEPTVGRSLTNQENPQKICLQVNLT